MDGRVKPGHDGERAGTPCKPSFPAAAKVPALQRRALSVDLAVSIAALSAHSRAMERAITYSFWGLGFLALGAIALAMLVW